MKHGETKYKMLVKYAATFFKTVLAKYWTKISNSVQYKNSGKMTSSQNCICEKNFSGTICVSY